MRLGEGLDVRVRQAGIGTPELVLTLPWRRRLSVATDDLEDDGNGETELSGTTLEALERAGVEQLREACDAFLEGRTLPR